MEVKHFKVKSLFKSPKIYSPLVIGFLSIFEIGVIEIIIEILLRKFQLDSVEIAFSLALFTTFYAITCPLAGLIPDKVDKRITLSIACFAMAICTYTLGLYGFEQRLLIILISLVISGSATSFALIPVVP